MDYNISKPSTFLSQYVKHYWSLNNCMPVNSIHTQRIVPCGLFELIFYLNDKPQSSDEKKSISDNTIITGQQKGFYDITVTGKLSLFSIYFQPHGLSMFLNLPLNELFNQSIPLRFILKDFANKLEDELSRVEVFESRVKIVEKFLIEKITKIEKKYQYDRIRHTVNLINRSKGIIDIEYLASESCLSRKQFERTFAEIIGTSPKQFLKIVRFQNAIYQKSKYPNLNLTVVAHKCGYYDQAHMINDFKTLSGFTPKNYFGECEPISDYFD